MLRECEDGLIKAIREAPIGRYLSTVASLPDIDGDALVRRFGAEAPAAYVAPGRITIDAERRMDIQFGVGCVVRSARGQAAARKGDGKAIGLYQLIEGVLAALHTRLAGDLLWEAAGVDLLSDATLADNGLHVAVVHVRAAGVDVPPGGVDESTLADFEIFHADYDVPPHDSRAEHEKWLAEPPDHETSAPDVSDTIQLPQEAS
jgi:hypothetical protein